jgi:hypothetical protein
MIVSNIKKKSLFQEFIFYKLSFQKETLSSRRNWFQRAKNHIYCLTAAKKKKKSQQLGGKQAECRIYLDSCTCTPCSLE